MIDIWNLESGGIIFHHSIPHSCIGTLPFTLLGINSIYEVNNTGVLENSSVYINLLPGQEFMNLSQELDVATFSIGSDVVLPSGLDCGDLPYGMDVESFQSNEDTNLITQPPTELLY